MDIGDVIYPRERLRIIADRGPDVLVEDKEGKRYLLDKTVLRRDYITEAALFKDLWSRRTRKIRPMITI